MRRRGHASELAHKPARQFPALRRLGWDTRRPERPHGEGITYNHPDLWFRRPDGDVVQLPGNPQAVERYLAQGFLLLNAA